MIDLHIHTTFSDGQYSPEDVVRLCAGEGVTALSITDHDTIAGLGGGRAAAGEARSAFVPGIELSLREHAQLHVLGYYIDENDPGLNKACARFQNDRLERAARIYEYLERRGVTLDRGIVERLAGGGQAGRPHFARAMVEQGYASSVAEAFGRHLGLPAFSQVERPKPGIGEAMELIRGAGGVPVLAHPALLEMDEGALGGLVGRMAALGLGGIECYYSTDTPRQTRAHLRLAHAYGLIATAGSDFHGEDVKPGIRPGRHVGGAVLWEDEGVLEKLRALCGA